MSNNVSHADSRRGLVPEHVSYKVFEILREIIWVICVAGLVIPPEVFDLRIDYLLVVLVLRLGLLKGDASSAHDEKNCTEGKEIYSIWLVALIS